ncbi:glycoside hydrolase family 127 protein [Paramicrobacterium chengjingii]|uniref:Glycoside hydrolase family 127 protein n=1 Tax=Paramicrobacterium chengjingii TaxID=2769067 RepID=A0ABX6YH34_9MICO|nr:beta-L-arabinofuranosidase domain-containing protein [Microbacterium chengjingii]QPZ38067.1 glycoside hydrolase family 127 protein [Microbacterium chengjingii]
MPLPNTPRSAANSASVRPAVASTASRFASLGAAEVTLASNGLLGQWQRRNREQTLVHSIEQLRLAGNLDNFRAVIGGATEPYRGRYPFLDTDVYKTLEGIAYELALADARAVSLDASIRDFYEEAIGLMQQAQLADGYLNTYFQADSIDKEPWSDLAWGHELYSLGHLIQAAVAANRQLGDPRLLDIAARFSDLVWQKFGPHTDEKLAFCGHPEVEMALVELFRETENRTYLELADLMVRRRGNQSIDSKIFTSEYFQDLVPFVNLDSVTGHAVRMMYLASGATDVAIETGADDLERSVLHLWDDMVASKLYITGGLGSRHSDEAIGDRFELPSERAYNETCAAIALMQWAWRMLLSTGEARFADIFEIVQYNAFAVGLSDDGCAFFYDNPLQRRGDHMQRSGYESDGPLLRRAWFGCPCCPPNIIRWVSELQDHVAFADEHTLHIANLTASEIRRDGLELTIATGYPWDGDVVITVTAAPENGQALALRIPAWAHGASVERDGEMTPAEAGSWAPFDRVAAGESIRINLPMRARAHGADPRVDAVRGSLAVARGPLVYCAEQQDNECDIDSLVVSPRDVQAFEPDQRQIVASGPSVVLSGAVTATPLDQLHLYPELRDDIDDQDPAAHDAARTHLTLVPYFQWGNREAQAMRVWLRTA